MAIAPKHSKRVQFEDEVWAQGFTQVPNVLIRADGLDPDSKMVLILILSYGWQDEELPDQPQMASDLNRSPRWLWDKLKDLRERNILLIEQESRTSPYAYTVRKMEYWQLEARPASRPAQPVALAELRSRATRNGVRVESHCETDSHTVASRGTQGSASRPLNKSNKTKKTKSGADAPTRSASRLRMISTEDDKALAYVRRVALKLSRDVFKNKNSAPETIDRYESWFTDLMAQDEEATPRALVEFLNAARDDPYFKGKAHIFTRPEQIVKLWSDWQATGTIRVETKPRTPAHIQREHDYASNGEVDYSHEEQTLCCSIPARFGHAYDCPRRTQGQAAQGAQGVGA